MPKRKTRRGAAKRFSLTASGKVKYKKAYLRHILTSKTAKNKRGLRKSGVLNDVETSRIKQLLPYQ